MGQCDVDYSRSLDRMSPENKYCQPCLMHEHRLPLFRLIGQLEINFSRNTRDNVGWTPVAPAESNSYSRHVPRLIVSHSFRSRNPFRTRSQFLNSGSLPTLQPVCRSITNRCFVCLGSGPTLLPGIPSSPDRPHRSYPALHIGTAAP